MIKSLFDIDIKLGRLQSLSNKEVKILVFFRDTLSKHTGGQSTRGQHMHYFK